MIKIKNKKATIGATMTWVVATIIIFLLIVIFMYASFVLAKDKNFFGPVSGIFPSVRLKLTEVYKEQTLLALLNTEFDGMSFEHYLILYAYPIALFIFVAGSFVALRNKKDISSLALVSS